MPECLVCVGRIPKRRLAVALTPNATVLGLCLVEPLTAHRESGESVCFRATLSPSIVALLAM